MVINELKSAFNLFAGLNYKAGFSALMDAGKDVFGIFLLGYAFSSLRGLLRNKNLKPRQKILPMIGHGLYFLTRGGLAIAVLAGAGALIPFFLGLSSIVGTYRNFMAFYKERKEIANLEMELMPKEKMLNIISSIKDPVINECVLNYVTKPDLIYEQLYDLRKKVMTDPNIEYSVKLAIITDLNDAIVKFSQNDNSPATIKVPLTGKLGWIIDNLQNINKEIQTYQVACEQYNKLDLRTSFKEKIAYYKLTHAKIFSQDLPSSIKNDLMKVLDGGELTENNLNPLYASLGNHYLNTTASTQLKNADEQFLLLLEAEYPNKAKLIQAFIQSPRNILRDNIDLVASLEREGFAVDDLRKISAIFSNEPASQSATSDLLTLLNDIETNSLTENTQIQLANAKNKILEHLNLANSFSMMPIEAEASLRIKTFQKTSLNQYASIVHQHTEFPSPAIKFNLHEGDLLMQSGITPTLDAVTAEFNKGVKKLTDKQNEVKKDITKRFFGIGKYNKILKNEAFKKVKSDQHKQFESDFDKRYENTFSLTFKKERLNFVKYSAPRRLINAGLTTVAAGISLLAIAAPATYIMPALTTIGMVFSGSVMVNSIYMYRKQEVGAGKIRKVTGDSKKAAGPDFETFKQRKANMQKMTDEVQQKIAQEAELKSQPTKRRWYKPLISKSPKITIARSENMEGPSLSEHHTDNSIKSNKHK